jgi:hypothetical protein
MASPDEQMDGPLLDPYNQTFTLMDSSGEEVPIWLRDADDQYAHLFRWCLARGIYAGMTLCILTVMLAMTPRNRFTKWTTIVNLAMVVTSFIKAIMLGMDFIGATNTIYYNLVSDPYGIPDSAFRIIYGQAVVVIIANITGKAAVIMQAWAMLKLWRPVWKWTAVVVSVVLQIPLLVFQGWYYYIVIAAQLNNGYFPENVRWISNAMNAISTTTLAWFAFIFIARLVAHTWKHRDILPSRKGQLTPMDVLILSNALIMILTSTSCFFGYLLLPTRWYFGLSRSTLTQRWQLSLASLQHRRPKTHRRFTPWIGRPTSPARRSSWWGCRWARSWRTASPPTRH